MKRKLTIFFTTVLVGLVSLPLAVSGADSAADRPLETNKDKVSYSIGLDLGKYLINMKGKIDYELLKQGIDDGFSGAEPRLSQEEITSAQEEFAAALQEEQEAQLEEMKQKTVLRVRRISTRIRLKREWSLPTVDCSTKCWKLETAKNRPLKIWSKSITWAP